MESRTIIRTLPVFYLFLYAVVSGYSQKIVGYSTVYDDRLDKWLLITDDPKKEGTIEATWALMDDWSEWQYTLGDQSGWIRLRDKKNPNIWELVGEGQILEIRTVFPFEFDHWQIRYRNTTYDIKTRYKRDPEQWLLRSKKEEFYFYTYVEGDIRDWIIENKTDFPVPLQIAMTFVPILQLFIR